MEMKLDVYRPKVKNPKPLPTLIFIHGGGWRAGIKESYSLRVLPWLEKGWNVVNVAPLPTETPNKPQKTIDGEEPVANFIFKRVISNENCTFSSLNFTLHLLK